MKHRLPRRLIAAAVGVALAGLVAELGLRAVGWSNPQFYRPDAERGWGLAAGVRGVYTAEGRGRVEVNRFGFRGDEPRLAKPAGTFRIALLGDSQAEALQVDLDQTFGEILAQRLTGCPSLPSRAQEVEVLNFGVSGYGTGQALLTFRHLAVAFEPDLVLLAVYTGNDVRNNLAELELDPLRPYFRLDEEGRPVLDDSFRDNAGFRRRTSLVGRAAYAVLDGVRLAQLAKALRTTVGERRAAAAAEARAGGGALAELGLDNAVYRPPGATPDDPWRRAWEVTEALVLALDREVAAAGADLALATLSNGIQVHPDAETRSRFAARLGVDDLTYPDRRLTGFARQRGIPAVALVFPLRRLAEERGLFLHGFEAAAADVEGTGDPDVGRWNRGHWNRDGHRAAGGLLARWLCEQYAAGGGGRLAPGPGDPRQ